MPVKRGGLRLTAMVAAATIVGLAATGCAKTAPTTRYVIITPSPIPATSTPLIVVSDTPNGSSSATASATVSATATPVPTALPSATAVPSTACTGSASNQAFWAEAASATKWDVYCAVLPAGWYTSDAFYEGTSSGTIHIILKVAGGPKVEIDEGSFCTTDAATCSPHESLIGKSAFGDLLGDLDALSGGGFAIYVNPGTAKAYSIKGSGMSQDTFVAYAAALAKVARS